MWVKIMKTEINEASFQEENIPDKFFVSIMFDAEGKWMHQHKDKLQQLANLELHGLVGLSQSPKNIVQWFGMARDAMIIMSGKEVIKLNKISRMMYENPKYFFSKNMSALYRIFELRQEDKSNGRSLIQRVVEKFMRSATRSNDSSENMGQALYDFEHDGIESWLGEQYLKNPVVINNSNDFAVWMKSQVDQKYSKRQKIPFITVEEYRKYLDQAAEYIGKIYKTEGEWILKDKILRVPQGSTLMILIPDIPKDVYEAWKKRNEDGSMKNVWAFLGHKEKLEKFEAILHVIKEYGLDSKYKIKLVNHNKLDQGKRAYNSTHDNFL